MRRSPRLSVVKRSPRRLEAELRPSMVATPRFFSPYGSRDSGGVGPAATLEISPGPGLTLVVGRNGSGKSSFAEALELLLTGDNSRWSTRSAIWREGWRNLHHAEARIDAEFVLEGSKGKTSISRHWAQGAKLEEAETLVTVSGSGASTMDDLGWAGAVEMHRPFLSYSELGSMLDSGPSALYDALSAILGLEDLVVAEARLKEAAKDRRKQADEATSLLAPLLERLGEIEDERAHACLRRSRERPGTSTRSKDR